jgi:hypothetical protein
MASRQSLSVQPCNNSGFMKYGVNLKPVDYEYYEGTLWLFPERIPRPR